MLKLLNVKTGNIFILPDVEAMRLKAEDRAGTYRILDSGFQEEEQQQVSAKTIEELVMGADSRAREIEKEDEEQEKREQEEEQKVKEGIINDNPKLPKVTEDTLNLEKINKKELVNMAKRLGLNASVNEAKNEIIKRIRSTGIL